MKDVTKLKIVTIWGWTYIVLAIYLSVFMVIYIYELPTDFFIFEIISNLIFLMIGYFILKYKKKAKEIMFFENLRRWKKEAFSLFKIILI